MTWALADGDCELAQPKTQQEMDDVVNSGDTGAIWIGLTCGSSCKNKQNWRFSDGSIPDSSFPWSWSQPNSATAGCAYTYWDNTAGHAMVNDVLCNRAFQFACEWCAGGYTGADCAIPPPCDSDSHCSGHGTTSDLDSTDGCVCDCAYSYSTANCSVADSTAYSELAGQECCVN